MIYVVTFILLGFYVHMLGKFPEYTVVWGVIYTFAYFAIIEVTEKAPITLENTAASVIGWFAAPFLFWTIL